MEISFDNPKHELLINNYDSLCRKYDTREINYATEILDTVNVLYAADALSDVPPSYRPHPLHGEYKGCFAVNIDKKYRVIFRPNHNGDDNFRIDNHKSIKKISIIEIFKNYHE